MIIGVPTELIRIFRAAIRRADHGLASSAAANAADSMNARQFRQLDDARTMRDLQNVTDLVEPPPQRATAIRR